MKTKSAARGDGTFKVEITTISTRGFHLRIGNREWFVAFDEFPWFRDATIKQLLGVTRPSPHHLRWPALDVDLAVESLEYPARYPLVSRAPEPRLAVAKEPRARYKRSHRRRAAVR